MGSIQPSEPAPTPEARARIEALVTEAERLVDLARAEADRIVSSAREETTRKVEGLVAQAEELRSAAETEAAEMLREAEESRQAARAEADIILTQARETHDDIVRRAHSLDEKPAGSDPRPVSPPAGAAEARDEANRILRVARAEAEARAAEIVEEARRKVENMEADARRRVEELRRSHRQMQRKMRDEEMEARRRIEELTERAEKKEPAPPPLPPPPPEPAISQPDTQEKVTAEVPRRVDATPAEYPWSIRSQLAEDSDDPDVLKALRAFRRRT